jgi:hypothetical protein
LTNSKTSRASSALNNWTVEGRPANCFRARDRVTIFSTRSSEFSESNKLIKYNLIPTKVQGIYHTSIL